MDLPPDLVGKTGGRRLLHDLLVASLQRAVAVPDDGHAPAPVPEDLHLDMPRGRDVPLQIYARRGEVLRGDAGDPVEAVAHLVRREAGVHADSAATTGRLDHHRQSYADRRGHGLVRGRQKLRPGKQGDTRFPGERPGRILRSELLKLLRGGTDEHHPLGLDPASEVRVLRQEPISGMDGTGSAVLRSFEKLIDVQIRLPGGSFPDVTGIIRHRDMGGRPVGIRIHGERPHSESMDGAYYSTGDFPAIGHKHGVKHD